MTPKHPISASLGEQQAKDCDSAHKDAQRINDLEWWEARSPADTLYE